ncbi:MAG TPA: hypothetical protein VMB77_00990 [Syntrophales bacterium]|nr:hypothetical protein [Syntrophales bacterium]
MSARIDLTNLDRHYEYTLILDREQRATLPPLKRLGIDVVPGKYELSFLAKSDDELPVECKPIQVTIQDGKALALQVNTVNLSVRILDSEGTQLNGKLGFLCGKCGDGVYVENPIE